jgi:pyridoxine 5-phosphate synthase
MATKLSVNINKYALLRNSRGHDVPHLPTFVDVIVAAGAHGITVHPRRDQRHIRFDDVPAVMSHLRDHHPGIEYNVECEDAPEILDMVLRLRPEQCTLVPVTPGEVTSDHGWDPVAHADRLRPVVRRLADAGIRVSCFADCEPEQMPAFAELGVDRVELYTGPYAWAWGTERQAEERHRVLASAQAAVDAGLVVNAGHDLDRFNLEGLRNCPGLAEVSIGHAQISRALEVGTTQSVKELLQALG